MNKKEESDIHLDTVRTDKSLFEAVPKYFKLKEYIKEMIMKGYKAGSKLPSERELAKKFDMNHTTVNKAISILVQEKYLYREHGKGTLEELFITVAREPLTLDLG